MLSYAFVPVAGATVKNCENNCVSSEQFLPQRSKKHASPKAKNSFCERQAKAMAQKL